MPAASHYAPASTDEAKQPFKQPDVHIGQVVLWFPDGNREVIGTPCVITKFNEINVTLHDLLAPAGTGRRRGVRHCDDPILQRSPDSIANGGWDFPQGWKAQLECQARVLDAMRDQNNMIARIDKLEKKG